MQWKPKEILWWFSARCCSSHKLVDPQLELCPAIRQEKSKNTAQHSNGFSMFLLLYFSTWSNFLSGELMSSTEASAQILAQEMLIKQQVSLLLKVIILSQRHFIWAFLQKNLILYMVCHIKVSIKSHEQCQLCQVKKSKHWRPQCASVEFPKLSEWWVVAFLKLLKYILLSVFEPHFISFRFQD